MSQRRDPLALMRRALAEPPPRPERIPPAWWRAMVARAGAGRASVTRYASGAVPVAHFDAAPGETLGPIASTEPAAVALAEAYGAAASQNPDTLGPFRDKSYVVGGRTLAC